MGRHLLLNFWNLGNSNFNSLPSPLHSNTYSAPLQEHHINSFLKKLFTVPSSFCRWLSLTLFFHLPACKPTDHTRLPSSCWRSQYPTTNVIYTWRCRNEVYRLFPGASVSFPFDCESRSHSQGFTYTPRETQPLPSHLLKQSPPSCRTGPSYPSISAHTAHVLNAAEKPPGNPSSYMQLPEGTIRLQGHAI